MCDGACSAAYDSVEQNIRNMQASSIFTIISVCLAVGTASDSVVFGGGWVAGS